MNGPTTAYGLFHWRGDGRYPAELCLKTYKTRGGADRAAARLYEQDRSSDIVAREYYA